MEIRLRRLRRGMLVYSTIFVADEKIDLSTHVSSFSKNSTERLLSQLYFLEYSDFSECRL